MLCFIFLVYLVDHVNAHGLLTTPTDRTEQSANGNKLTPFADYLTVSEDSCGGEDNGDGGPGDVVASFSVGDTIDVVYDITITHPLEPGVRIAVRDPSIDGSLFTDHILYDFSDNTDTDVDSGEHTLSLTLPTDLSCISCELQWLWASESDGGFYIGCADIEIAALSTSTDSDSSNAQITGDTEPVSFGDIDTGVNSNIIAAAVLLPLSLIVIIAGMYHGRSNIFFIVKKTPCGQLTEQTRTRLSVTLHALSAFVLTICLIFPYWASDEISHTTFGLFAFCSDGVCTSMATIDPSAQGAVEGAQACVIIALILSLACIGVVARPFKPSFSSYDTVRYVLSCATSVFWFLGVCLYSAYFYDILSVYPDMRLGWSLDLIGVWWVVTLLGVLLDSPNSLEDGNELSHMSDV